MLVYFGLGSNLGDRERHLAHAIRLLAERAGDITRSSSVYETAPWGYTGYTGQPPFFNCVMEGETMLSPEKLLGVTQSIEKEVGRQETFRWGPRTIDIDILLYGDMIVDRPDLQIPHPRMHERAFVLVPLAELTSGRVHSRLGDTISELLWRVDGKEGIRKTDIRLALA